MNFLFLRKSNVIIVDVTVFQFVGLSSSNVSSYKCNMSKKKKHKSGNLKMKKYLNYTEFNIIQQKKKTGIKYKLKKKKTKRLKQINK